MGQSVTELHHSYNVETGTQHNLWWNVPWYCSEISPQKKFVGTIIWNLLVQWWLETTSRMPNQALLHSLSKLLNLPAFSSPFISRGVNVLVHLPASICLWFQLALFHAPVLVSQTFAVCIGMVGFPFFCLTWTSCPHHYSILEMTWSDSGYCLLLPWFSCSSPSAACQGLKTQGRLGTDAPLPWPCHAAGANATGRSQHLPLP